MDDARSGAGMPPLVVDLDGTLLRSDLLLESALSFLRAQPRRLLMPLLWACRGRAVLKAELARATELDPVQLPYDNEVIALIGAERARGRRIVLATGSHRALADRVAGHLGLFDEILATEGGCNLSGAAKRDALVSAFGPGGFDYAGNAMADLPVWEASRHAYVVNAPPRVERRARALGNLATVLRSHPPSLASWAGALRVHQWLKNLLIFLPLLASHRMSEIALVGDAVLAFVCFCLCASSAYIQNDLIDLAYDRGHPDKRSRPFASGRLPIRAGIVAMLALLAGALGLALARLPASFAATLVLYYGVTLSYSLWLKKRMVVDVMTLAGLYTLRVVAGGLALGIVLSFWLLAFSMFIFLSLALVKRYAELFAARADGRSLAGGGRGYEPDDLSMVAALGAAAGYMAVLVLAFYINDPNTARLYRHPQLIWLACPLLLGWISRVWMLAHRGRMNEDPVIFAIEDRASRVIVGLLALDLWAAI